MADVVTREPRALVERVAKDAIRLERVLDAPPEIVWSYLTQADLREQWFMGGTDVGPSGEFDLLDARSLMERGDYTGAVRRTTTAIEALIGAKLKEELAPLFDPQT